MYYRDPNKPTPGASHPDPEPRHLGSAGRGNAPQDGYTVTARRPRAMGFCDIETVEKADRMEEAFRDMGPFGGYPFGPFGY